MFLDNSFRARLRDTLEDDANLDLILVMDWAADERLERTESVDGEDLREGTRLGLSDWGSGVSGLVVEPVWG